MVIDRRHLHPDLLALSDDELERRTHWLRRLWSAPRSQWIGWHGDLIRPDGGQGMYATQSQADAWPHKVRQDAVIGPGKNGR